jgi:hypothetical protein
LHWTYSQFESSSDLEQGDILAPNEALRAVLSEVHPHFCKSKYLGFAIATQSCDLVRRGRSLPKARHISVSVIRSLKQVIPTLLSHFVEPVADGVFRTSCKLTAKQFLQRLFNQNEQSLGLFYLHPDASVGVGEPSVVYLRVHVALKAKHYDVLAGARTGRLEPEFRAKFGWLIGNLYARAASRDWTDAEGGKEELDRLIDINLNEQTPGAGPVWVDDELVAASMAAGTVIQGQSPTEVVEILEKNRPPTRAERLVQEILGHVTKQLNPSDDQIRRLKNRLLDSGRLRKLVSGKPLTGQAP